MTIADTSDRAGRQLLLGGAAVVAAGLGMVGALLLRWGRCIGDDLSVPCNSVQNHTYDYALPVDPWVPIPGAAQFYGLAHLLLAVGVLLVVRQLTTAAAVRALGAVVSGALALVGVLTLVSGVVGVALGVNAAVSLAWGLLGPVLLGGLAVALLVTGARHPARPFVITVLAGLALTMPWQELALLRLFSSSYDTPPWTGWIRAALLLALGLLIVSRSRERTPSAAVR